MYLTRKTKDIKLKMINALEDKDDREKVGYWRKANHIHGWFVENVQDGEDKCEEHKVSEEQLKELLEAINRVLNNHSLAEEILPTTSGFFFGGTEYDDWYFDNLKESKDIIEKVLAETDFEKQEIFYCSSW